MLHSESFFFFHWWSAQCRITVVLQSGSLKSGTENLTECRGPPMRVSLACLLATLIQAADCRAWNLRPKVTSQVYLDISIGGTDAGSVCWRVGRTPAPNDRTSALNDRTPALDAQLGDQAGL